jgi:hypothetical protein
MTPGGSLHLLLYQRDQTYSFNHNGARQPKVSKLRGSRGRKLLRIKSTSELRKEAHPAHQLVLIKSPEAQGLSHSLQEEVPAYGDTPLTPGLSLLPQWCPRVLF